MSEHISDYSYFLFSTKNKSIHQGTGFLIKKDTQLFLVTASHNFHADKTSTVKTADTFYLRVIKKSDNKPDFIKINNNPVDRQAAYRDLDINFYKIQLSDIYQLNTVDLNEISSKPTSVISYGYATVDGYENTPQLYMESIRPTEFRGELQFDYKKPLTYFETGITDYSNYVVSYLISTLGKGMSGSPVFSEISKNGKVIFNFAGLLHIRNELTKTATILRPEIIKNLAQYL